MITVRYSSIDGFSEVRRYKTIFGARRFAQKWLGKSPEMGSWYAVSGDGVGRIEVLGGEARVQELFGDEPKPGELPEGEFKIYTVEPHGAKYHMTRSEAEAEMKALQEYDPSIAWGIQEHTVTKEDLGR